MSFDKDKGPDPALQAQLRQAQEDHDEKKAQMKQMEENNKMAEALAPALQALASAQQEQQMGQLGGQNPYGLASAQMPGQVAAGSAVSLNTNAGSAAMAKPAITSTATLGGAAGLTKV
ncbi:MAG: hypothetical protein U1E65_17910 [Myxococcota bacterium]